MSNCVICSAVTRVANYSSNFFTTRVSLFYISGCQFPFPVAFFTVIDELLEFIETWGFAILFTTCQPGNGEGAAQPAAGLKASAQRYTVPSMRRQFFLFTDLKCQSPHKIRGSKITPSLPRYADPPPCNRKYFNTSRQWRIQAMYSSLAACIKVLPVLTSTRVESYSLAAVLCQ